MFLLNDVVVLLYHAWKKRIFTIEQNLEHNTVLNPAHIQIQRSHTFVFIYFLINKCGFQ